MLAADLELSPTIRQKAFMQNFYLYLHFTKPTFRLYLSSNKENMPSKLIKNFYKMFPNMPKLEDERMEGLDLVCTRQDAIRYALEGISGIEEEEISDKHKSISAALKATMVSGTIDPVISDILCRASQKVTDEDITAYAFKLLYGDLLNISVSKVEQYAKCPFSFFAEYGLGLEERKIYEIGAADMGSIFHGALEIYSTELSKQNYDFGSVPEETREVLVKEAVDKAMCDIHESVFSDTKRNEYMRERIEKMMQKTAWALGKQYKAGSFNAKDYEKAFSVIEEGMRISGKIDRVDYATVDNQSYVKIIDYKSSQKKIDYGKIYDGLNIQLFVYLHSLLSDTVKPSAAMYYAIDDPVVDVNDEADTEKETLKKLKPTGIVNCEKPSLDALIGNETENQSLYIPASITQKGELNTRCTTAVTESQLRLISEYSYEKLISLGKEIKSGKVAASPYSDSCEYCKYSDLCPFDSEIKGNNFRQHTQIKKLENQTVVQVAMEQFSKALNKDKEVKDENGN